MFTSAARDLKERGIVGNWTTLSSWIAKHGFPAGRIARPELPHLGRRRSLRLDQRTADGPQGRAAPRRPRPHNRLKLKSLGAVGRTRLVEGTLGK